MKKETSTDDSGVINPMPKQTTANQKASDDSFYGKLSKLHESSGLSLVFNFQEAILDLHLLYKEVTQRGGFYRVTKYGKWDEVASTLNLQCCVSMGSTEIQTVYKNLLHQFEQIYHYRLPKEANTKPGPLRYGDSVNCVTGKRKYCNSSSSFSTYFSGDLESPGRKKSKNHSYQLSEGTEKTEQIQAMLSSSDKELMQYMDAPIKPRTGYQIFLRIACNRLNKIYGGHTGGQNLRDIATEAWRKLSEEDKLVYIEVGKNDRERYTREMTAYEKRNQEQNAKNQNLFTGYSPSILTFTSSSETENDYFVSSKPEGENFLSPDKSLVEVTNRVMKNAQSNDPILQSYWDEFYDSLE